MGITSYTIWGPKDSEDPENLKAPQLPSLWEQAKSVTKATVTHIMSGMEEVTPEERQRRMDICGGCEYLLKEENRCGKCLCFLGAKQRWASQSCPMGYWESNTEGSVGPVDGP